MRHVAISFIFALTASFGLVSVAEAQEPVVVQVAPQQVSGRVSRPMQVLLPPPRNVYARTERTRPSAAASRVVRTLPTPTP